MNKILNSIDKNTWIVSDLHLGHKNITKFEPTREVSMQGKSHEDWVIDNWNSVVKPTDNVLCLGDFAFNGLTRYSERLNGNKILILGNHDRHPKHTSYISWTVIDGIYVCGEVSAKLLGYEDDPMMSAIIVDIDDERVLFSHYPVFDDNQYDIKNPKIVPRMKRLEELYTFFECSVNVHGHTHSKPSSFKNSINASLDVLPEFKPTKLSKLIL